MKKLIKEFHEKESQIADKLVQIENKDQSQDKKNDFYYLYLEMYSALKEEGYKIIGSGYSRTVFANNENDYVVKIASSQNGVIANKGEINLSTSQSSSKNISSILPYIYSHSEKGNWLICEKVNTFKNVSLEDLKKVFPTFYYFASTKMIGNKIIKKDIEKEEFKEFISNVFFNALRLPVLDVKRFLMILKRTSYEDHDIKSIYENFPLKDVKRFVEATTYDFTADLHLGNLGIRKDSNLRPESFVILDYDISIDRGIKKVRHRYDVESSPNAKIIKEPPVKEKEFPLDRIPDFDAILAAESVYRKLLEYAIQS